MSYTVGSLFAGVGGICSGFKNSGATIKWANEYDISACDTYQHNFPKHNLSCADIQTIKNPKGMGFVDILTSGFPCQAFSIAGHRKGFEDPRGNMFFETARFINSIKPKAFLLENVKNLTAHDKGKTFKVIADEIKDLGYSFIPFTLNAMTHGNIPQNRERIFIVGFKGESKRVKVCTRNFEIPGKISLTKTIRDLLDDDEKEGKYYYHNDHQYYKTFVKDIKSFDTIYQWRRVRVRENKANVCPTLTANMGTGGHNVPIIRDKFGYRKLTPIECVRFQGFNDDFSFPDGISNAQAYKQAGNSVVIPVIERIAKEMIRVLDLKYKGKHDSKEVNYKNTGIFPHSIQEEMFAK